MVAWVMNIFSLHEMQHFESKDFIYLIKNTVKHITILNVFILLEFMRLIAQPYKMQFIPISVNFGRHFLFSLSLDTKMLNRFSHILVI